MSSNPNIKEVIEVLCQILMAHGCEKISPEELRQAKYNKAESTDRLLQLIKEVIILSIPDCKTSSEDLKELSIMTYIYVLYQLGYPRTFDLIYCTEFGLSSNDLLLAFGYLLLKLNFFSKLRQAVKMCFVDHILPDTPDRPYFTGVLQENENLNCLIVTHKRIDFALRSISSSLRNYERLIYQSKTVFIDDVQKELNENSSKVKFKRTTLLEFILQENLELQRDLSDVLQKQNDLLRLHIKWLHYEHVFWKWLNSAARESLVPFNHNSHSADKFKTSLLLADTNTFNNVVQRMGVQLHGVDKSTPRLTLSKTLPIMREVLNADLTCSDDKGDNAANQELIEIQNRIRTLQERNKSSLSQLFNVQFSNLIELPRPKR